MATYEKFWNEEAPSYQTQLSPKESQYNFLNSNLDKVNLSPDEQYKMGWGADGLSEDWIKQKAQALQKQIEGDVSTSILKGTALAPVQKAAEAAVDAATSKEGSGVTAQSGGSSGSGSSRSGGDDFGGSASPTADDSMPTFGHDKAMQAALLAGGVDGLKYSTVLGPLLGGGIGLYKGWDAYKRSREDSLAHLDNMVSRMSDADGKLVSPNAYERQKASNPEADAAAAAEAAAEAAISNPEGLSSDQIAAYQQYSGSRSSTPSISSDGGMSLSQATSTEGTGSPTSPSFSNSDGD